MLKLLKNIGCYLYTAWFYILAAIPILLLFPILAACLISEKTYKYLYWIGRNIWATFILYGMGCFPKIEQAEPFLKNGHYMLVANHTSLLDAMLMLRISKKPVVFVGKKELKEIPVFGFLYSRACIMVDRERLSSRAAVYPQTQRRIDQGLSVCIFPEAGVPEEHITLDRFKDGAFKMAISHKLTIVPMSFLDCKKRLSWTPYKGGPGVLRVKIHKHYKPEDFAQETYTSLRNSIRSLLLFDVLKNE